MSPASTFGARRSWIALRAGLALLALSGAACEESLTERYRVSGYVRDLATGEGIGGVDVTFTSDTLRTGNTRTSGNGAYAITVRSDVPFGQVRATRDGYIPDERTVYFDASDRRVDLGLREAPPAEP